MKRLAAFILFITPVLIITSKGLAGAPPIQVTITVEGGKGKTVKEMKDSICSVSFSFLKTNFPYTEVPSRCGTIEGAEISLNVDVIIESQSGIWNLLLELKDVKKNFIIKQRSSTIDPAQWKGNVKEAISLSLPGILKELIPAGWTPPETAGEETVEKTPEKKEEETPKKEEKVLEEKNKSISTEQEKLPVPSKEPEKVESSLSSYGEVLLAVSETEATLVVDGKASGTTPAGIISGLSPGIHKIELQKKGCKKYEGTIEIPENVMEEGVIRRDVMLECEEKPVSVKKKSPKWWVWVVVAGAIVVGGGGAATAGVLLSRETGPDAVRFPNY